MTLDVREGALLSAAEVARRMDARAAALEQCYAEQRAAAACYASAASASVRALAQIWLTDWLAEEILIMDAAAWSGVRSAGAAGQGSGEV